jgi:hypothetical protein
MSITSSSSAATPSARPFTSSYSETIWMAIRAEAIVNGFTTVVV